MDRIEIFQVLGIEETKDEKRIKNAYRGKLSVTNPEDDPEGFKRLRTAYEEACRLAKDSGEKPEEQPRDTTPSGLWLEEAAKIYNNIHTRQELQHWEKLFADDCFLSLEDEENCRFKLLRFLMEHFKLPTEVWKLLDRKLSITSDAARLREQFPADFVRYILNKCERGEDVEFSQFQGPEDGDYDLYLQYYDRTWQALAEEKLEEAAQCMENADRLGISHPVMEICRGDLLRRQGKDAEAIALMEGLLEQYPKDAMVCYNTAELLWKQEQAEGGRFRKKAVQIYQELKEENDSHYMANVRLTEWYYEEGQYKKAKSCAEKVLSSGSDDSFMELLVKINAEIEKELEEEYRGTRKWEVALELCWCYLQDGKVARGIRLATDVWQELLSASMEQQRSTNMEQQQSTGMEQQRSTGMEQQLSVSIGQQLPLEKEAEFYGLMAKLYVEEAEYELSIAMCNSWEEALYKKLDYDDPEEKRDRDRLKQAHLIRMQCYHNLGFRNEKQFGKAVEEGSAVLTDSAKDIGVLLEQAQLYVEMEEYERSLELVDRLLEDYQVYAAYAVALEAYRKQLDAAGVVRSSSQCIRYFPTFVKAYEYAAKVYLDLNYKEDLEKLLGEAGKNNVKSDILEAYRYQITHRPMELSTLHEKLRNFREKYVEKAEMRETVSKYEDGLKIITEYLYHYPDSYLFTERGEYHRAAHHYEEAKEDFEKAIALEPGNSYALSGLSQVYKAEGDFEKALIYLKRAILYKGDEMPLTIYQDMGNLYALLGDNRRALAAHLEFMRLTQGQKPGMRNLEEVAEAWLRAGQADKAIEILQQIEAQRKGTHIDYFNRVEMYNRSGNEQKAREMLGTWRSVIMATWREKLEIGGDSLIQRWIRHLDGERRGLYSDFFKQAARLELIFGDPGTALRYFQEALACTSANWWALNHLLEDAAFACIVCGDDEQGKKYGERMEKWLEEQSHHAWDVYFNEAKRKRFHRILIGFYTEPLQAIQELLDQEKSMERCQYCTRPFCSELEGIRIMLLCRQGKREEAMERLKRNLEIFPQDDYMLAIRHVVFGDSLDPPLQICAHPPETPGRAWESSCCSVTGC